MFKTVNVGFFETVLTYAFCIHF